MTQRNLLHKTKLEAFKRYLDAAGIAHRAPPTTAPWQVLQVECGQHWQAIYRRANMPEHLSVPEPLVRLVELFIRESKFTNVQQSSSPGAAPGRSVISPGVPE